MSKSPATGYPRAQTIDEMLRGYRVTQMLHVAAKLGIADHLKDGPLTATELAPLVGGDAGALYRLVRALASLGVFMEDSEGRFGLTEAGTSLRSDVPGSNRNAAIMYGESWWWGAWGGLFDAVRTGRTAFEDVHGVDLFGYLRSDASAGALFNACMQQMTSQQGADIVSACDFSSTRKLIDIGGGHGALAAAVLSANPDIAVLLFDIAEVIESAQANLVALGIAGRCEVVAGDFFVSVPPGGDTYTLKDILHDWNDEQASVILRNIHRAMDRNGRLLVIERVIPEGNSPAPGKLVDISMLVLTGGKERTESEYKLLLSSAGFSVQEIIVANPEMRVMVAGPA